MSPKGISLTADVASLTPPEKLQEKQLECLSVPFPRENPSCCEKARVFLWCCSLMAKQSLQGSVLQLASMAEHPGPNLCCASQPSHPGETTHPGGDRTVSYLEAEHKKAGGDADHIKGVINDLVFPKMCLWVSGTTHSCLLEMVDVCHELHPTMAVLGEQGAWE